MERGLLTACRRSRRRNVRRQSFAELAPFRGLRGRQPRIPRSVQRPRRRGCTLLLAMPARAARLKEFLPGPLQEHRTCVRQFAPAGRRLARRVPPCEPELRHARKEPWERRRARLLLAPAPFGRGESARKYCRAA